MESRTELRVVTPCPDGSCESIPVACLAEKPLAKFIANPSLPRRQPVISAGADTNERVWFLESEVARLEAENRNLQGSLAEARTDLEERKVIERAKGIVQQNLCCTEDEAYRQMQHLASGRQDRIIEVARSILHANEKIGVPFERPSERRLLGRYRGQQRFGKQQY